jgi:hypothetical protein
MEPPPGQEAIFLSHDRLDCRRESLRIVSKQEARQHHRVRRDSRSGVKGVRYNPDNDTRTALASRNGRRYQISTYCLGRQPRQPVRRNSAAKTLTSTRRD